MGFFSAILFLKSNIVVWDKAKILIIFLITAEIIKENIICGIWYIKLKLPPSTYIKWNISSVKNRAFTV